MFCHTYYNPDTGGWYVVYVYGMFRYSGPAHDKKPALTNKKGHQVRKTIIALVLGLLAVHASAQGEDKLVIKPTGRVLMDGGLFDANADNDKFNDGFAVPDLRIGVKAKYGNWGMKADVCYAYNKVGLKDVHIEYWLNGVNYLRAGYFVHHFGLQSATSSSFKETMEEPMSSKAFFNSRLLGVMYAHTGRKWLATASVFSENDAMKMSTDKLGNQGVGGMTRQVYHPLTGEGRILHVGLSGAVESPRYNDDAALSHRSFVLKSTYPIRVASVTAAEAKVTEARTLYKFSPELVAAYGRLAVEGQYFYVGIDRRGGLPSYRGTGGYVTLRGMILGRPYTYNCEDGGLSLPRKGALEAVLSYDYADLSDHKAGILGGRTNDYSLTLSYYINKYVTWRVRGSFTQVSDRAGAADNCLRTLETRLQFKF